MLMILRVKLKGLVSSPALCPVQFFLKFRLGMTDNTDPLQYASHSWILGRVSFNNIGQCTILSSAAANRADPTGSPFNGPSILPPTWFAVGLLSPLASSQAPAPRTTFAETPLFEVCSAKVGPRCFVFHQHFSKEARHRLCGPLHVDLNVECVVTAIRRPWNGSHSEYSVRVPSLRLRDSPDVRRACLDRQPLLGDNHCL